MSYNRHIKIDNNDQLTDKLVIIDDNYCLYDESMIIPIYTVDEKDKAVKM